MYIHTFIQPKKSGDGMSRTRCLPQAHMLSGRSTDELRPSPLSYTLIHLSIINISSTKYCLDYLLVV